MDTERIITISIGAIVVLSTVIALVVAFTSSRNIKGATEIVKARNTDVQWQDRTEAALKELGLANDRVLKAYQQAFNVAISAALLVNKDDAADFLKNLSSLGVKVLDGQPNVPPAPDLEGVMIAHNIGLKG